MVKYLFSLLFVLSIALPSMAQLPKVYDEAIDPVEQIDQAVAQAAAQDKFVICQYGGNWCRWCLMFADFITNDEDIAKAIDENFVYIHVNRPNDDSVKEVNARLNNAGRLGYPALVVLDQQGNVIHLQDSSYLEEGEGYNKNKVQRFLKNWTPMAVNSGK